ncbi:transmembrane protein 192 isoform X2 [Hemicordylus capensis]|nr:transmembrane protein 192 isoform X2 [Hemicordylus capensis]XP_053108463.1 transmembrane protein 192 isoform X2 [Hemicordylus capensis]XP_053108464.1 transmembrane protein 192 isoform X2 [Hemicordylus capensis]
MDDDPLLDAPLLPPHSLHSRLHPRFYSIPTVCMANILLLIHVTFVILAILAGVFCVPDNDDICFEKYTYPFKVQTAILIAKVALWILHVCFERCIQYHHRKVRSKGYLLIYRTTRHLKRLPLLIHSTGNAALLLIVAVQYTFPGHAKLYLCCIFGILSMELMCSLICLVVYSVKVSNFNRAKSRPDIIEEEKMYSYPSHITSEVGFREISSLEEIVEKQGDVIEYLQRHNALLSKRLLALTAQQDRG